MFLSLDVEFDLIDCWCRGDDQLFLRMDPKTYLFNRLESRVCRLNGIVHSSSRPEKAELRQTFSSHVLYSSDQLPPKVDLRPNLTEVEDQSTIGSWLVHASFSRFHCSVCF